MKENALADFYAKEAALPKAVFLTEPSKDPSLEEFQEIKKYQY